MKKLVLISFLVLLSANSYANVSDMARTIQQLQPNPYGTMQGTSRQSLSEEDHTIRQVGSVSRNYSNGYSTEETTTRIGNLMTITDGSDNLGNFWTGSCVQMQSQQICD